jgi:geranylgeranylglyceryl phosphate synthase family protein
MTVFRRLTEQGGLAVLIDPPRTSPARAGELARQAAADGAQLLLLGNSFGGFEDMPEIARTVKAAAPDLPVLLFPGSAGQLVADVDAILMLSLVSGRNPQYLIEEHVRAVPFFMRYPTVESISTAYLLIDGGRVTSVEAVSQTRPLPSDKPELVSAHVQAAMRIGMRAVYLDAGSGADRPVPPALIAAARGACAGPVFVGGGVRDAASVRAARDAGADFVVVGTVVEDQGSRAVRALAHAAR